MRTCDDAPASIGRRLSFTAAAGDDRAGVARAASQSRRGRTDLLARATVAGEDSAEALVLNPANLGYQPGRAPLHGRQLPRTRRPRAAPFDLAAPLFWGMAPASSFDYVEPPAGLRSRSRSELHLAHLVFSLEAGDAFAFGFPARALVTRQLVPERASRITRAVSSAPAPTSRSPPSRRDFNGPAMAGLSSPAAHRILDPSYVLGIGTSAPTGTRRRRRGARGEVARGEQRGFSRRDVSSTSRVLGPRAVTSRWGTSRTDERRGRRRHRRSRDLSGARLGRRRRHRRQPAR